MYFNVKKKNPNTLSESAALHTVFALFSPAFLSSSPLSLLSVPENVNKGLMKEINRLQSLPHVSTSLHY